jgi:transcription initiation factor IIE alpha subunit
VDEDIEDFYRSCIMASSFKGEFKGESKIVIVKIGEPKGIRETSEEELKKLTNILINRYG